MGRIQVNPYPINKQSKQTNKNVFSEGYLDNNTPFSFHKHYDNDPIQVYGLWFGLDDQKWWSTKAHDHPDNVQRDEL